MAAPTSLPIGDIHNDANNTPVSAPTNSAGSPVQARPIPLRQTPPTQSQPLPANPAPPSTTSTKDLPPITDEEIDQLNKDLEKLRKELGLDDLPSFAGSPAQPVTPPANQSAPLTPPPVDFVNQNQLTSSTNQLPPSGQQPVQLQPPISQPQASSVTPVTAPAPAIAPTVPTIPVTQPASTTPSPDSLQAAPAPAPPPLPVAPSSPLTAQAPATYTSSQVDVMVAPSPPSLASLSDIAPPATPAGPTKLSNPIFGDSQLMPSSEPQLTAQQNAMHDSFIDDAFTQEGLSAKQKLVIAGCVALTALLIAGGGVGVWWTIDNTGGISMTSSTSTNNTLPPAQSDKDSDGLSDAQEQQYQTNPNNPDTDGDGFTDGQEVNSGYNPTGPGKL